MKRATAEERALARASVYRLLSLAFTYPTADLHAQLEDAVDVALVGASLLTPGTASGVEALRRALSGTSATDLERSYQSVFTLSYNEDCPPYETAFSAGHVFQQTQHQADVAGFYRAFGVVPQGDRPDHLAVELEFAYLLALKEAQARADGNRSGWQTTRAAHRAFMREHLGRWSRLVAGRIVLGGGHAWHTAAGRLLDEFIAWDESFLRVGKVEPYRDEPIPPEPAEMDGCPMEAGPPFVQIEEKRRVEVG